MLNLSHSCHSFIRLNRQVCSNSIPEIVLHGSQEHGACSLLEYLTCFPAPRFSRDNSMKFEMWIRPRDLFEAREANRIEIVRENSEGKEEEMLFSVPVENKSFANGIYENLLSMIQGEDKTSLIIRVHWFVENENENQPASFLNIVFIPLELQSCLSQHIENKSSHSFYCFVQNSNFSIRTAIVTRNFSPHVEKVSYKFIYFIYFILISPPSTDQKQFIGDFHNVQ